MDFDPFRPTLEQAIQLHQAGRLRDAEQLYRQVLAQQPNHADALHLLGVIAHQVGQNDRAAELIGQAIASNPNLPEAYCNLGSALQAMGQLDQAIVSQREAIVLRADYPEAHFNLGNALKDAGQLDEAIAAYRRAIALRPSYTKVHDNLIYSLYFHPGYNAREISDEQHRWNEQHAEPFRKFILPHCNDRDPDRRLRIGYVSPDFRNHCQALFMVPLLSAHDHREMHIVCYSDVADPDSITGQLQTHADTWRNIFGQSDEQVASLIRGDQIDILVDLTMHMARNRLLVFARKPAPLQVCWLAYPGGTGLTTIDYRLSDPYLDPIGVDESIYSERTIRLPDTFWCYDPLDGRDIAVNSLPALRKGVVTFGCLNNLWKVNEPVLGLWARVLRQIDRSRLMLLAERGTRRQAMLAFLESQGVEPDRVEFFAYQPRRQYLQLYHGIDLGLDTYPYNGHTTSLDSLWMGVPVVTLVGQTPVSRAGWCHLSNLGMTELAARDPEQFVQIAVDLAMDIPRLAELRQGLRERLRRSPLCDAVRFARNIENAYRQIWRKWCRR